MLKLKQNVWKRPLQNQVVILIGRLAEDLPFNGYTCTGEILIPTNVWDQNDKIESFAKASGSNQIAICCYKTVRFK